MSKPAFDARLPIIRCRPPVPVGFSHPVTVNVLRLFNPLTVPVVAAWAVLVFATYAKSPSDPDAPNASSDQVAPLVRFKLAVLPIDPWLKTNEPLPSSIA